MIFKFKYTNGLPNQLITHFENQTTKVSEKSNVQIFMCSIFRWFLYFYVAENEDKKLWDPSSLTQQLVEDYLAKSEESLQATGVTSLPLGSHIRDDEQVRKYVKAPNPSSIHLINLLWNFLLQTLIWFVSQPIQFF